MMRVLGSVYHGTLLVLCPVQFVPSLKPGIHTVFLDQMAKCKLMQLFNWHLKLFHYRPK